MNFCPDVSVITVSGVISMCSIRSEFKISPVWFSRVTRIIDGPHSPMDLIRRPVFEHIAYRRERRIVDAKRGSKAKSLIRARGYSNVYGLTICP
jgi:hypothetical protein